MNKKHLLVRYDKDLRLRMIYPEARKEITRDVVRVIRKAPGTNVVSFTFANEGNLDRVIDNELNYFIPLRQPFTWKVYEHDLLPSLKSKLASRGFAQDGDPVDVMVLDVKNMGASLSQPVTADVRRIDTTAGLKDVIHVLDKVWGGNNSWINDRLGTYLRLPGYLSVYVAYVGSQPTSVAWTHFPRGHFALLSGGFTIEEYRRQGLYTSLLLTQVREVRDRGYRHAIARTGAMNKPIVVKHGFQHLTTVHDFQWRGS